jgi:DegV family protein with EDD domain
MKKTICQIVDSSGNLPRDFIKQYNISEVPFYFKFDDQDYDSKNSDSGISDFYKHMEKYPQDIPKTSAPNINDWLTVFEEQYARGAKKFIVTTISAKLSASFQTAMTAKRMFEEKNNDVHMEVISSNTCACGQAALETGIAKMIDNNRDFGDIVKTIHRLATNISTLFAVDSLKYI